MSDSDPIIDLKSDEFFMGEALRQARKAYQATEVPIGCVIVRDGKVIARGYNQVEMLKDATAHAEMLTLTSAQSEVGDWRLTDCDLYVTKEPCAMCAGAIVHCRIRRVIFGCPSPKVGAGGRLVNLIQYPALNHQSELLSGVREEECA
ncbi:MAG: tRNA adenosine(34) deaminase TadA, partial [Verrucomicrobiota bacterium]